MYVYIFSILVVDHVVLMFYIRIPMVFQSPPLSTCPSVPCSVAQKYKAPKTMTCQIKRPPTFQWWASANLFKLGHPLFSLCFLYPPLFCTLLLRWSDLLQNITCPKRKKQTPILSQLTPKKYLKYETRTVRAPLWFSADYHPHSVFHL